MRAVSGLATPRFKKTALAGEAPANELPPRQLVHECAAFAREPQDPKSASSTTFPVPFSGRNADFGKVI